MELDMVADMEVHKVADIVADKKQGQKMVLSDALAVQSQGLGISRSKGFKS